MENSVWDELKNKVGAKKAAEIVKIMEGRKALPLTPPQQLAYDYILSGKPVLSLRQMAADAGFDHPQKLTVALAGLFIKGYLVLRPKGG